MKKQATGYRQPTTGYRKAGARYSVLGIITGFPPIKTEDRGTSNEDLSIEYLKVYI
jgi:hypothetical protein